MLFDLRGRGRRRTIQAIYVTLAILMGGGLVLFGIGGNTSGGLFDAFKGGGGGGNDTFSKQITQAEKTLKANPNDAAAWVVLARARFQQAGQGDSYDQQTSQFTDKGKSRLQQSATAWEHYLSLNPRKPDDSLASLMVQVYSPSALNQPAKGVKAAQIVTATRPTAPRRSRSRHWSGERISRPLSIRVRQRWPIRRAPPAGRCWRPAAPCRRTGPHPRDA